MYKIKIQYTKLFKRYPTENIFRTYRLDVHSGCHLIENGRGITNQKYIGTSYNIIQYNIVLGKYGFKTDPQMLYKLY